MDENSNDTKSIYSNDSEQTIDSNTKELTYDYDSSYYQLSFLNNNDSLLNFFDNIYDEYETNKTRAYSI